MNKLPEALRLAEESDNDEWIAGTKQWREEAAAELRRLHAALKTANDQAEKFERLWYLRGDLNEALVEALEFCAGTSYITDAHDVANAALLKATGDADEYLREE